MAIIRTILKIPLPDGEHEIHVVKEDRNRMVLFSLVQPGDDWSVRNRPTLKLPQTDAMRLGKFLCGIQDIDGITTERIEREVTKPGVDDSE